MERLRIEEIIDRAARAPSPPFVPAVATDADGTLWGGDVGDALFLLVAARDDFRGRAVALLDDVAARVAPTLRETLHGGSLARALFDRYEQGAIDVRTMCDLEAAAVADRSEAEFDALIAEVCAATLPNVRMEVRALLEHAAHRGLPIHVVSGSLGVLVERMLRAASIPFDTVTGTVLARDGGTVRAEIARTSPLFEGKVDALRAQGAWPAAIGLGDGGWDHTFLRQVHTPVLVHPKQALVDAMRGVECFVIAT